jgi:hypothetical protein
MKSARRLSFLFALVASAFAAGFPAVKAEEPAQDLAGYANAIESLTPEQARRLAAEFPGAEQAIIVRGSSPSIARLALPLNGLTALDAATAKELAGYGQGLNEAWLNEAWLVLNGLPAIDAATAGALANYKGANLVLNGLAELDAETARALANYKGANLVLNGLTALDAATARALANHKGGSLALNGLTTLDAATAKALAEFRGKWLFLGGLAGLDADTAQALAELRCNLVDLSGLLKIDAEVAGALAAYKGHLVLNGLPTLDAAGATALARFKGHEFELRGLESLDADAARALATSKAWKGRLSKLTTLDAPTAEALAEYRGDMLMFEALDTPDAETARALAKYKGHLFLSSEMSLDVEVARALASFKGPILVMNLALAHHVNLDPAIVQAFGAYEGNLGGFDETAEKFVATHPLSPENALGIVSLTNGELGFLTALDSPDSVDIAKALATRKGRLALPNLKKISPKTLTALITKEDVEIPLTDTLEFIREPDGSPTEDFVIPAWLDARQRARAAAGAGG